MSDQQRLLEALREQYAEAIVAPFDANLSEDEQRAVLAELRQFLVVMMDWCEQTLLAEPAIIAAHASIDTAIVMGVSR